MSRPLSANSRIVGWAGGEGALAAAFGKPGFDPLVDGKPPPAVDVAGFFDLNYLKVGALDPTAPH